MFQDVQDLFGIFTETSHVIFVVASFLVVYFFVNRYEVDILDFYEPNETFVNLSIFFLITSVVAIIAGLLHKFIDSSVIEPRKRRIFKKNFELEKVMSDLKIDDKKPRSVYHRKLNILKEKLQKERKISRLARKRNLARKKRFNTISTENEEEIILKRKEIDILKSQLEKKTEQVDRYQQIIAEQDVETKERDITDPRYKDYFLPAKEEVLPTKEEPQIDEIPPVKLPEIPPHVKTSLPSHVRMLELEWKKTNRKRLHKTIWMKENLSLNSQNIELDKDYLIRLFSRGKKKRRSSVLDYEQQQDVFMISSDGGESDGNQILGNNQPITLFLRQLEEKTITTEEFIESVRNMDEQSVTFELHRRMISLFYITESDISSSPSSSPTKKDRNQEMFETSLSILENYNDDLSLLPPEDLFIMNLVKKIGHFRAKMYAWMTKRKHGSFIEKNMKRLNSTIKYLNEFIRNSTTSIISNDDGSEDDSNPKSNNWKRFLQIILSIGNYINGRNDQLLTHGFQFNSTTLENFTVYYKSVGVSKVTGDKITFLQYLVEFVCDKYPDVNNFLDEFLECVLNLRNTNFERLFNALIGYHQKLDNVQSVVKEIINESGEKNKKKKKKKKGEEEDDDDDPFVIMMNNEFFVRVEEGEETKPYYDYKILMKSVDRLKSLLLDVSELYGLNILDINDDNGEDKLLFQKYNSMSFFIKRVEGLFDNISKFCVKYKNELEEYRRIIFTKKKMEEKKKRKKKEAQVILNRISVSDDDDDDNGEDHYYHDKSSSFSSNFGGGDGGRSSSPPLSPSKKRKNRKKNKKSKKSKKKNKKIDQRAKMKKSKSTSSIRTNQRISFKKLTAEEKKKEEEELRKLSSSEVETLDFLVNEILISELDYLSDLLNLQERISSPCKHLVDPKKWNLIFSDFNDLLQFHTSTIGDELESGNSSIIDVFGRNSEGFSQLYLKFFIDYKKIVEVWKEESKKNHRLQLFIRKAEERRVSDVIDGTSEYLYTAEELLEIREEISQCENETDLISMLVQSQKGNSNKKKKVKDDGDEDEEGWIMLDNNNITTTATTTNASTTPTSAVLEMLSLPVVRLGEYRELFNKLSNFVDSEHNDYSNLQTIIATLRSLNEQKELLSANF